MITGGGPSEPYKTSKPDDDQLSVSSVRSSSQNVCKISRKPRSCSAAGGTSTPATFSHDISIQIGEFYPLNLCAKIQLKSSAAGFLLRLALRGPREEGGGPPLVEGETARGRRRIDKSQRPACQCARMTVRAPFFTERASRRRRRRRRRAPVRQIGWSRSSRLFARGACGVF